MKTGFWMTNKHQKQAAAAEQHWCQIFIFIEKKNYFLWKINENQLLMVPKGKDDEKKVWWKWKLWMEKLATSCAIEIFLRLVVSVSVLFFVFPQHLMTIHYILLLCCAYLCLYLCLTSHKLHSVSISLTLHALFCSILFGSVGFGTLQRNVSEWKFYVRWKKKEWMRVSEMERDRIYGLCGMGSV